MRPMCRALPLVALLLVLLGGCAAPGAGNTSGKPIVVTSTTVLADLIRNVVGDRAEVVSIVPAGRSPIGYEPSPNDAVTLSRASLVFTNGLYYERFMAKLLTDAGASGVRQIVLSADLRTLDSNIDHGDHQHRFPNPYLYLDTRNAMTYVERIRDAMIEHDGKNADAYRANATAYRAQLDDLDRWIAEQIGQVPEGRRRLMQDHASLTYYGDRYGLLAFAASYEGTSEAAPSASQYANLLGQVRQYQIATLLGEEGYSPRLLEQLARDTGARLVPGLRAATLGTTEESDSYLELMRANTRLIVESLR